MDDQARVTKRNMILRRRFLTDPDEIFLSLFLM
jgi:hypothetical protein